MAPEDGVHIPVKTKFFVYLTHCFTTMGARMWWFGIGLFLIEVTPDSLRLTATYGFTNGGAILLLASVIGDLIDKSARLKAARVALVLNNSSIIVCCAVILLVLIFRSQIEAAWDGSKLLTLCYAVIVIITIFTNLCNVGRTLVMERDWIVEICKRDNDAIATISATFRFIDLCTKVVAPLVTGQIMTYTSHIGGAIFIACWNFFAMFIEYQLLWKVYSIVPALHIKSRDTRMQVIEDMIVQEKDKDVVEGVTVQEKDTKIMEGVTVQEKEQIQISEEKVEDIGEEKDGERQKNAIKPKELPDVSEDRRSSRDRETSNGLASKLFSSLIALYRGWRYYKSYDVWLAGVALAFLYFTVLGFDNITIGYATTQGMTESILGILIGGAAIFGIIASISYPFIRKRIGLVRTGVLALTCQVSCLCLCIISLWMPGGTFDPNRTWSLSTSPPEVVVINCSTHLTVTPEPEVLETFTTFNESFNADVNSTVLNSKILQENFTECLNVTVKQNIMPKSRASVIMLMMGIMGARFGVWLVDLTVTQLFLETVVETERGIVNGFQSSLNKLMDMLKFILVMFIPDPSMFGYPAIVSFCFIFSAWLLYAKFARRRNGFLCCK